MDKDSPQIDRLYYPTWVSQEIGLLSHNGQAFIITRASATQFFISPSKRTTRDEDRDSSMHGTRVADGSGADKAAGKRTSCETQISDKGFNFGS